MDLGRYHQADFDRALSRNLRALTRNKISSDKPQAILLGGQSGAGKTTIHRIKQKEFQGNIIIIDGDSFRPQHPYYLSLQKKYGKDSVDYTKGFAGAMVEALVDELSQRGYHLLIEGTLRTVEVPESTATLLKKRGYMVSLAIMATKPELSYLSTQLRYQELYSKDPNQARATPKEHHDLIVDNLVENLRVLEEAQTFDRIQLYHRDKQCLYDSEQNHGSASRILQETLFGNWTPVEKAMLEMGESQLRDLRQKNET